MRFSSYTALAAWALVAAYASLPQAAQAHLLPANQFANNDRPDAELHAHRRLASGRRVDSPFGSGCVGTTSICALSHSSADRSERATLRREIPPTLWQVAEDMEWERSQREATAGVRLEKFLERLGGEGETHQKKLTWSQEELIRRQKLDEKRIQTERAANEKLRKLEREEEEADRLRELGWKRLLVAANEPAKLAADRDIINPRHGGNKRNSSRKLTRQERLELASWHHELRERMSRQFETDVEVQPEWIRSFDADMLKYNGVDLPSLLKKRSVPIAERAPAQNIVTAFRPDR
ncbi:hypothetical protein IE81DRAFT_348896 [Ceraceosorus guamensis]|uniref:Uncharacterized protein n=1 Tax=Ceraceosorus guamensis TaxID=1522189 RepID=A0A316VWZ4_9BASI|nr:hypothetical protein IE81DRAFT_348896 [Ceraceosorus guamensis]PWN40801.1 hypothetical protein IE81DRAFT_348896 [Ceraceosorus guamensis]